MPPETKPLLNPIQRMTTADYKPPYPFRHNRYLPNKGVSWWQFPLFMIRYAHNSVAVFSEFHYRIPVWKTRFGFRNYFVVNDPTVLREVLVKKSDVFGFDPIRKRVLKNITGDSLLTVEGPDWKRARQIVAPIFNPRVVGTLAETMQQTCERMAMQIANIDGDISLSEQMGNLTLEVLVDTLFSGDLEIDRKSMRRDMEGVLTTLGSISILDVFDVPDWVPRLGSIATRNARKRFRAQVQHHIASRRTKLATLSDGDKQSAKDLLTMMLEARGEDGATGLTDIEVEDNLMAFIGAGHETTAQALSWTLYILSQCTEWRDLLEEEIDSAGLQDASAADWAEKLPLTKAVLEESMRLYPPVPLMVRQAQKDSEINGEPAPKGTGFIVWSFVSQRHESQWDEPDTFRPERFLSGNREKIDRFAYLPFGAGPRVCVGVSFAMQEAVIALASIMRVCRFTYIGKKPPQPKMRISLRPDNGVPMRVTRR